MSRKSRARYYLGEPLRGRPHYHTMRWYDKKQRQVQSSVEVLINIEYVPEEAVWSYMTAL